MDFSVYFFSANDRRSFSDRYDFILDAARYIDRNGFDAIWTPERHFEEFGGSFPNPSVLSAGLATVTENLDLRAGSVVLPLHHPIRIVEEWSLVDQLSKGRAGLCIATGWHRGDFVLQPNNYENRREIAFDGVETLRRLWRGETMSFDGAGDGTVDVATYPRPVQDELPLWLVYSSNPKTWIKAGEMGLNILALLDNFERMKNNIAAYREARSENGFDPDAGIVTVGLHTFIGDDDERVRSIVDEPVKAYLSTFLNQRSSDADLDGDSKDVNDDERQRLLDLTFDDMYRNRSLLGTLPKCIDLVERLESIGVNEVSSLIDFGVDFDVVLDQLPKLTELKNHFQNGPTNGKAPVAVSASAARDGMDWYFER